MGNRLTDSMNAAAKVNVNKFMAEDTAECIKALQAENQPLTPQM